MRLGNATPSRGVQLLARSKQKFILSRRAERVGQDNLVRRRSNGGSSLGLKKYEC